MKCQSSKQSITNFKTKNTISKTLDSRDSKRVLFLISEYHLCSRLSNFGSYHNLRYFALMSDNGSAKIRKGNIRIEEGAA